MRRVDAASTFDSAILLRGDDDDDGVEAFLPAILHRLLLRQGDEMYALVEPLVIETPFWMAWATEVSAELSKLSRENYFVPHVRQVRRSDARRLIGISELREKAMFLTVKGLRVRSFVVRTANDVDEL